MDEMAEDEEDKRIRMRARDPWVLPTLFGLGRGRFGYDSRLALAGERRKG